MSIPSFLTFNRTIVELKPLDPGQEATSEVAFNRTIVELKLFTKVLVWLHTASF